MHFTGMWSVFLILRVVFLFAPLKAKSNCIGKIKLYQNGLLDRLHHHEVGGPFARNTRWSAILRRRISGTLPARASCSQFAIAKALTEGGIPTPGGKTNCSGSTVRSILTNEIYKGNALLQEVCLDAEQHEKKSS